MERLAQQRVLKNVRATLDLRRPQLLSDLRALGSAAGQPPTLAEFLAFTGQPLGEVLKRGLWSRLLHEAGLAPEPVAPDETVLAGGLHRLSHLSDPKQLRFLLRHHNERPIAGCHDLQGVTEGHDESDTHPRAGVAPGPSEAAARRWLMMLHVTLWGAAGKTLTLAEAEAKLARNPNAVADLRLLLGHLLASCTTLPVPAAALPPSLAPLTLHATYTRDESLAALGFWELNRRPVMNEGVLHLAQPKLDVFFVTLQKTESGYSPTTMYDDYAVSRDLFHWQSQNATHGRTPTGKRVHPPPVDGLHPRPLRPRGEENPRRPDRPLRLPRPLPLREPRGREPDERDVEAGDPDAREGVAGGGEGRGLIALADKSANEPRRNLSTRLRYPSPGDRRSGCWERLVAPAQSIGYRNLHKPTVLGTDRQRVPLGAGEVERQGTGTRSLRECQRVSIDVVRFGQCPD